MIIQTRSRTEPKRFTLDTAIDYLDEHIWLTDGAMKQLTPEEHHEKIGPFSIDRDTAGPAVLSRFTSKEISFENLPPGLDKMVLFPNLRSTLHRRTLGIDGVSFEDDSIVVANPTPSNYHWSKKGRFAHFLVGAPKFSEYRDLPHGKTLQTDDDIRRAFRDDLIGFEDASDPVIQNGFLILHASDKFYSGVPRDAIGDPGLDLALKQKTDAEREFGKPETFTKKRFGSNQHILLPTAETVRLSRYVALQLFYPDVVTPSLTRYVGFTDPGFRGDLGFQPVLRQPIEIEAGQPVLWGRIIHIPKGVGMDYSQRKSSVYQGQRLNGSKPQI
ncbi:hypothetical protein AUJ84_04000 [Candidatus Pacearchaeota archaeon CG1_02_32_132]|nr:MAG: hypothetical protein AUJ84_04000 [Candidatus Pacearchaeota archaeon CG1_02_32_132]